MRKVRAAFRRLGKASLALLGLISVGCGGSADPRHRLSSFERVAIVKQPLGRAVFAGEPTTFEVLTTGVGVPRYQWLRNGKEIPEATSATYTTPPTSAVDDGTQFQVVVEKWGLSVASRIASLKVLTPNRTDPAYFPGTTKSSGEAKPTSANNGAACSINDTPDSGASDPVFTYTCPLPNATGTGNTLLIMLRFKGGPSTVSFTDNVGGNTYTQAVSCTSGSGQVVRLYYVPNIRAGVNVVTVNFNTSTAGVAMGEWEYYNVGALDQAACQTGTDATTISSGALPTLGSSGDLIFDFGMVYSNTMIMGCTPSTEANIAWKQLATMILDNQPQCAQAGIYNATASFSPSFSIGTKASYLSAAAAFKAMRAGTAPPSHGIRVNYIQHDNSIVQNTTSALTQFPMSGNLAVVMYTGSLDYVTAISDGTNFWYAVETDHTCNPKSGPGQCSSVWYAANAIPGAYKLNFTKTAMSIAAFGDSYITYDISGAASSPLDAGFGTNGLASTTGRDTNSNSFSSITVAPSQPNELILVSMNQQFDTMTGLISPAEAHFTANDYTRETNSSHADLNGGWGLLYNGPSTTRTTWKWSHDKVQAPGVNTWTVVGAAFQPASP